MKGHSSTVVLSVAMLILISPLGAAAATFKVLSVDFSTGTISVDKPKGVVNFKQETKFEYGHDNPVDSSKLVVAKTIEVEYSNPPHASKVMIVDTSDENPPQLTQQLGNFPLDQIVGSVSGSPGPDRFIDVEGESAAVEGVLIRTLKPAFSTGSCRVIPDPGHVQCDYAYSNRLANILVNLVNEKVKLFNLTHHPGLILDRELSDASTLTFTDEADRVSVRFTSFPPTSKITVEVY